jgi:hypothetical protein
MYAYAGGYVVNAERSHNPDNLVLHRAMCDTITPSPDKPWTTGSYVKVCSTRRYELDEWARELGGRLRSCSFCDP